jgi:hypothetical protein
MDNRLEELEKKVAALTAAVDELRAKVEHRAPPVPQSGLEAIIADFATPEPDHKPAAPQGIVEPVLPLLGRTLLTFAGAFVIRALTDRDVLPHGPGVALGLLFGASWIGFAWRDASKQRLQSATFHGMAAALIGYPLVAETATHLGLLSAPLAALALMGFTVALAVTGWQHRLERLGWVAVLGGATAAGALMWMTPTPAPFRIALVGVALVSVALADLREWQGLRWPIAVFLDALLLRQVMATEPLPDDAGQLWLGSGQGLAAATVLLYLGALLWRTWRRRGVLHSFDVLQTLAVVGLGIAALTREQVALGVPVMAVAVGALATAVHLGAPGERHEDAWYYGLLGLGLAVLGGARWTGAVPVAALWGALALALAVLGRLRLTGMLWGFSVVLAWAAAGAGGLLEVLRSGLWDAPSLEWAPVSSAAAATLGLAFVGYALMTARAPKMDEVMLRATALAMLSLCGLSVAALVAFGVRQALGGTEANVAGVLVTRSLVLIALAGGAVFARRVGGPKELSWGAAGLLALCGLKLLVQDLPNGNAATLVVGFLALGLSVSLMPRALRGRVESPAPSTPAASESADPSSASPSRG